MKKMLLLFIIAILLVSCAPQAEKTGKAVESADQKINKDEEKPKQIDISNDPKKQEAMEFIKSFISTISFPKVEGYPVKADIDSFIFIGFMVDGDIYTAVTQFRLNTMNGPVNKQYTIKLKDEGNGAYGLLYVREDK